MHFSWAINRLDCCVTMNCTTHAKPTRHRCAPFHTPYSLLSLSLYSPVRHLILQLCLNQSKPGHIVPIPCPYFWHILTTSWPYLDHIVSMPRPYFHSIMMIFWPYHVHKSTLYWQYLHHIFTIFFHNLAIFRPYLQNISTIPDPSQIYHNLYTHPYHTIMFIWHLQGNLYYTRVSCWVSS